MSVFSSSRFISVAAAGKDWREGRPVPMNLDAKRTVELIRDVASEWEDEDTVDTGIVANAFRNLAQGLADDAGIK